MRLGLHLAHVQVLHRFNELNGKAGAQPGSGGRGVHQPLPRALWEPGAAADAGPGWQTAELSTRGLPLFQRDAEKQGRKRRCGAAGAEVFGFCFANEH